MTIDIESLREDLKNNCLGAFYGAGFGGALIESFTIDKMTPEELINTAIKYGIDLHNYEVEENHRTR